MACVMKVPMLLPRRGLGLFTRKGRSDSNAHGNADDWGKHRLLKYIINLMAAPAATVTRYTTRAWATIRAARRGSRVDHVKQDDHTVMGSPGHAEVFLIKPSIIIQKLIAAAMSPFNTQASSDVSDPLAVVEYVDEIYKFYQYYENLDRPLDYMQHQVGVSEGMRACVIDLIVAVHAKYDFRPETLYLTIHLIDRYLSIKRVQGSRLEVIGMSSFHIACKYEEMLPPEVDDIMYTTDAAYTREEMLATETDILDTLQWRLTVPTQYMFLVRFLRIAMCDDKEVEHMVFFLAELGLMRYSMVTCLPSVAAASAVYAARCTLNKSPHWPKKLKLHSGLSETQLLECAQILAECHAGAQARSNLKVVYDKYSSEQYGAVALYPPARELFQEPLSC